MPHVTDQSGMDPVARAEACTETVTVVDAVQSSGPPIEEVVEMLHVMVQSDMEPDDSAPITQTAPILAEPTQVSEDQQTPELIVNVEITSLLENKEPMCNAHVPGKPIISTK